MRIITLLLLLPLFSKAQIKTDTAFNRIIGYTEIVKLDSLKKEAIYSNTKKWLAYTFKSAKSVIEMDDKEAGLIIGKGNFEFFPKQSSKPLTISFTLTINIKDNKYKAELNNFDGIVYLFGGNEKNFYPAAEPKKKMFCAQCPQDWKELNIKFSSILGSLKNEIQKQTSDF